MINAKFYPAKGSGLWRVALANLPEKIPEEGRKAWESGGECLSVAARECSYPFFEHICISGTKKPPHFVCGDDGIFFTLFFFADEWRVYFWALRGEAEE